MEKKKREIHKTFDKQNHKNDLEKKKLLHIII